MSGSNKSREEILLELEKARAEIAELKARCGSSGSCEGLLEFENYFDAAGDPSSFLDSNYTYQAVNAAYSRYFGRPVEEILGSSVADLIGEEVFQSSIKPHLDCCLAGEQVSYEHWVPFPDLGRRYMHVSYYPRRNSQGEVIVPAHGVAPISA